MSPNIEPPIMGMTVMPYYNPKVHEADEWQAFMDFLRYAIKQPDCVEHCKKELGIKEQDVFEDKDLPRFADWVAVNLWGVAKPRKTSIKKIHDKTPVASIS